MIPRHASKSAWENGRRAAPAEAWSGEGAGAAAHGPAIKPASATTTATMPSVVPRMKSRNETVDAPITMLTRVNGAGTLRTRKTASVPLRFSARMTRMMRTPPRLSTRRNPSQRPIAKPIDALVSDPAIA